MTAYRNVWNAAVDRIGAETCVLPMHFVRSLTVP